MYKKITIVFVLFGMMLMSSCESKSSLQTARTDVYDGWKLGVQAWSFNRFTFYEAIDKTASLGLKYIEACPGQKISKDIPNITFGQEMPAEIKKQIKKKLKDTGVTLINFGVVKLTNDESQCRKVFDFAKEMGIETIAAEPPEEAFDMLDKLCQQYRIKLAVHNHPPPTHYWDPNTVLKVCQGRSKWIGACADTGHWMRSGVNPIEALKKLEGRIVAVHLKDLNEFGDKSAHDVPWGTGKADIKAILTELARQNFKGTFSVEYEYNWENSIPEIQQCVEYFNKTAAELKSK